MLTSNVDRELLPVAALVVGYLPHSNTLDMLLRSLLMEVQLVVLLDNGGASGYLMDSPPSRQRVVYVDMEGNRGVGAALNRGMAIARAAGHRFVVTFDQDSAPPSGLVSEMLDAMQKKKLGRVPCAAVGPRFYDRRVESARCYPVYRETDERIHSWDECVSTCMLETDVLITSGMLVDSDVWSRGLEYDERLFVDYTDTDWCFRARAAGYRLFVLSSSRMPHALSDAPPVRVGKLHLLRYSPIRRYYYFRNTIWFVRRAYVSRAWKRRLFFGLIVRILTNPFIDDKGWDGVRMSFRGIYDAFKGRMGALPNEASPTSRT